MPTRKIFMLCALVGGLVLLGGWVGPRAASGESIAVLVSHDRPPFWDVLAGFRQYLQQRDVQVDYDIYDLQGDPVKAAQAIEQIKKAEPRLIFSLGSLALREAGREIQDIPIVADMILKEEDLQGIPNATGAYLEFPIATQFEWLRRILPEARNIGVVYNPEENDSRIEAASIIARQMGLKLVAQEVRTPRELPDALKNLVNSTDVLWGVSDRVVLTPQTAKSILLFSFRNRIPFIGLSSPWVKAGALYALDRDYNDIGWQCGEMAYRVLQGEEVRSIAPTPPRKVVYSLNQKTARRMKVEVSGSLLRGAEQVF